AHYSTLMSTRATKRRERRTSRESVVAIKAQAKDNKRSLGSEVAQLLSRRASGVSPESLRDLADRIAALTPEVPPTDSTELVCADRSGFWACGRDCPRSSAQLAVAAAHSGQHQDHEFLVEVLAGAGEAAGFQAVGRKAEAAVEPEGGLVGRDPGRVQLHHVGAGVLDHGSHQGAAEPAAARPFAHVDAPEHALVPLLGARRNREAGDPDQAGAVERAEH